MCGGKRAQHKLPGISICHVYLQVCVCRSSACRSVRGAVKIAAAVGVQHALVTDLFQLQLQFQFQVPTHSPHSPIHYLCLFLFLFLCLSLSLWEPLKPFICSLLLSKLQLLPSLSSCLICPNQLGFTIFYPLWLPFIFILFGATCKSGLPRALPTWHAICSSWIRFLLTFIHSLVLFLCPSTIKDDHKRAYEF